MQITIACGAMPFGPETPSRRSLGGSETSALMLGKALAARGHEVQMFCHLPPEGAPDYFPTGEIHADGVRYVDIENFANTATLIQIDVLIAVRDPGLVSIPVQAKKKVLWCHDIATTRGIKRALEQMEFTFDEIWTVSEWHKYQVAEVTGYPEDRIVALRNGIVKYDDILDLPRVPRQILYAARPERGLDNLIRPGGVMEHLPDYKLIVCMYEHFPDHMRDYYNMIFARMKAMPNVEFIGGKPNHELRQIIRESEAYIYPTQFEETSCILARECVEQGTPFITTSIGALPETLDDCGVFFEDWCHANGIIEPERGSDGWCKLFALYFRDALADKAALAELRSNMENRGDLYWDGVAAMIEPHLQAQPTTDFSRLYSLIQDGDVIPAMALYNALKTGGLLTETAPIEAIRKELDDCYAFVNGDMAAYYDAIYTEKSQTEFSELAFRRDVSASPRHQAILDVIAQLPPGSTIFEYGCGPGHVLAPLAARFPDKKFIGYDFSQAAIECMNKGAVEHNIPNLAGTWELPQGQFDKQFDAVLCSEVLEHVVEPWALAQEVEGFCKPGGRVIFTVPFGPWEPETYENVGRWKERAHLWLIDRKMMVEMLGEKKNASTVMVVGGMSPWARPVGNIMYSYDADHAPTNPINPLDKAMRHWARETCAAAIIAFNNEDTIVRMLNSLDRKVQFIQIALGPAKDNTRALIENWFENRPWMPYRIIDVPKIEPYKFGFDDARNASIEGLENDFEWAIWIDTDEYLAGDIKKYLRPSARDAYLISQHHFTVEPRGNAPEIDRPARLMRLDRGFKCFGHIHEHFEAVRDGVPSGPGRAQLLGDVDIGHPGYVNEEVRKARFFRNWPFLKWEHEENPDRKLHKFLWFRDIIHRMRFATDLAERVKLAGEAVEWYNEHQAAMATFGPGMMMSLHYLAEAYTVLGRGVPLRVTVQMDDRNAVLEGRFESYKQIEGVLSQLLQDEFRERTGRYY
jgi:glycosyltransferase involved in cell wall biosynthesis/SAM-dependent methyltransferase